MNLGNFGGQLKLDDINGALRNTGSSFQFDQDPTAMGGATPPAATQANPMAQQTLDAGVSALGADNNEQRRKGLLKSALGLVAGYFTGGASLAAQAGAGAAAGAIGNKG